MRSRKSLYTYDFSRVTLIFSEIASLPNMMIGIFRNFSILNIQENTRGTIISLEINVIVSKSIIIMKTASLLQMNISVGKWVTKRTTKKMTEIVTIILMDLKIFIALFTVVLTAYRSSTIMSRTSVTARKIHVPAIAEQGAETV